MEGSSSVPSPEIYQWDAFRDHTTAGITFPPTVDPFMSLFSTSMHAPMTFGRRIPLRNHICDIIVSDTSGVSGKSATEPKLR